MKIKYFLLPILLFLTSLGFTQSSIQKVTVYKESDSGEGALKITKESFSDELAEAFRWQKYADFKESLFILRESVLKLDRKTAKRFVADQPLEGMAKAVKRITTIDHTGKRRVYLRQDIPNAEVDSQLWFECLDQENCGILSSLYLYSTGEENIPPLSILWSGRGECPEEYREHQLPTNYMLAVLEDENGKVLMKRSIHIIEFNTGDDVWKRVVEVDVETYSKGK